jgi:hypothetical protein
MIQIARTLAALVAITSFSTLAQTAGDTAAEKHKVKNWWPTRSCAPKHKPI